MKDIIIAYPVKDTALKLRLLLESEGYGVLCVCATGASALSFSQTMESGIVICASILRDMSAGVLADSLPDGFDVISLSKNGPEEYTGNLVTLPLPVGKSDLLKTVEVLSRSKTSITHRDAKQSEIISNAKLILMSSMDLTESKAHRYLQRESMRSGKEMVRLAEEIINDFTQ